MAYVQDTSNDQNAQQTPNAAMQQLPVTASGTGAGTTGANTSTSGSPQGAAAVPTTTQAPPVQNLQAYLQANQPQALQMGQNIAQGLTNTSNQVTGDINADQAAYDAQVQASNVAPNSQLVSEAAANPSGFVQDPNNVAAFQAQENANYTGPSSFEATAPYATLQQEITNAVNEAPNVNTPAGVLQLVTGQEQNPTLGMENLDQLLMLGTPGAIAPITAAEAPIQNLGTVLGNATTAEDQASQTAAANDAAAAQGVQSAFETGPNAVVPAWEQALQNEYQMAQNEVNAANQTIGSNKSIVNPFEQAYQTYLAQGGYGFSNPLEGILNASSVGMPTEAQVASPQDYATEAALEQLLGSNFTPALNTSNANEAGSFQAPDVTAYTPSSLGQNIADLATAATWGKQEVPNLQTFIDLANQDQDIENSYPGSLESAQADIAATGAPAESQIIANPSLPAIPNFFNPSVSPAYENLLAYLQSVDPSGIGTIGNNGYWVES